MLIRRVDPRRYIRVQRQIGYIVDARGTAVGSYRERHRVCQIDFTRFPCDWLHTDSSTYEWYLAGYAALIVHEATHGYLYSRGVPYTRTTRAFSERMCVTEQQRFAARLQSERFDFAHDLVAEYDPEDWRESWNRTKWQRWIADVRKLHTKSAR